MDWMTSRRGGETGGTVKGFPRTVSRLTLVVARPWGVQRPDTPLDFQSVPSPGTSRTPSLIMVKHVFMTCKILDYTGTITYDWHSRDGVTH